MATDARYSLRAAAQEDYQRLPESTCSKRLEVQPDEVYSRFIWICRGQDKIGFTVTEKLRYSRRQLTADEKAQSWNRNAKWTQTRESSGILMLRLRNSYRGYDLAQFVETPAQPLETMLNQVMVSAIEQ